MKKSDLKTKIEEIATKFKESYDTGEVQIIRNEPDHLLFELTAMYAKPFRCSDEFLDAIKEATGFKYAEHYDDISESGCESCDYGSSYGFAVRCWQ